MFFLCLKFAWCKMGVKLPLTSFINLGCSGHITSSALSTSTRASNTHKDLLIIYTHQSISL
ncbi:hypothetical protein C5468_00300 [Photorhabdus luminescens subsp. mexicana]|uniref:Uncharacterized protein n=1 Tax=Photorhabdus luminescens subsp. mexicana TaxID=2100167 RepID=A0A4R4JNU1_PHOLU|nr:hypothetical protein C5468_00300 [Photorhabdus luminescens subsp. mexicana]